MLAARPRAGEQGRTPRLSYRPALDGLRALAVIAVFAYHANAGWAQAGFLGVDVFFVLSGYLITALLLGEHLREGGINLVRFWARRARRLLPALLAVLAAVAVAVPLLAPEQAYRLRGDLLAALGYVSNWRFIFEDQSYFQGAGRPPLLQHLWSLAVEEQFYLLWPLALTWMLRRRAKLNDGRVDPLGLVRPLLLAALASAALMALLFEPYADPSRVYYGTDTRAAALLLGAALACATTRWQTIDNVHPTGRHALEIAGAVGLAGLAWAIFRADEFNPALYRGGFLVVALLAVAVVAAAARPGEPGALTRALSKGPLVWLGRRSYAIYLWFWPVLMLTRPNLDVPVTGTPLLILRAAITVGLAALSYRFIEQPARAGGPAGMWGRLRPRPTDPTAPHRPPAVWALAAALAVACVGLGVVLSREPADPHDLLAEATGLDPSSAGGLNATFAASLATTTTVAATVPTTAPPPDPATTLAPVPSVATTVPPTTAVTVPAALPFVQARVTALGDSVLLGAKPLLEQQIEGIVVDAVEGRNLSSLVAATRSYQENATLGEVVVLHVGNNGPLNPEQFGQLLESLKTVGKVLVINAKVERTWQDHNNEVIADAVKRQTNAALLDWHSVATANADAFYTDGLHLTQKGIRLFTQLVLSAL